jgi:hypothetical protein
MKITVGIPDLVLHRIKAVVAKRGISLRQFVIQAIDEKLKVTLQEKPWWQHLDKLKHSRSDGRLIGERIEEAFGKIDRKIWN